MALSYNTLAVQGNGGIYFFASAEGSWNQEAFLDGINHNNSLGLSGDTLAVGKIQDEAVYVYTRTGSTWTLHARLTASNADGGIKLGELPCDGDIPFSNPDVLDRVVHSDQFGISLSLEGENLVVGARGESSAATSGEDDNSALGAGAAYVFTRENGVWNQRAFLKASNAEGSCTFEFFPRLSDFSDSDYFGDSVAISSDTIVVGAPGEDSSADGGEADNSESNSGAVYSFQ
jgi:hypothetical protein